MSKFKIPNILKSKKFWTVSAITLVLFFAVFQTGLAARINLPFGIMDKIRSLLNSGNISISAADYKDGTIILIKPIATGNGEGRYEAGDIVEIRDGEELYKRFGNGDFLGWEEKSKLIPLYLPQKLTEEQKQELMASEYENPPTPLYQGGINTDAPVQKDNQGETGVQADNDSPLIKGDKGGLKDGVDAVKMTKRRKYGVDYTLVLSDRDILKIRQEKALDKIPEIKFEEIIDKNTKLSYSSAIHTPVPRGGTTPLARGDYRSAEKSPLKRGVPRRGGVCNAMSVICLPQRLAMAEKLISKTKLLANTIIKPVLAQGAPTELVKTVDTGGYADYLSLSAWEAGTQQDLTSTNKIAIAKCQHKTATSTADTTAVEISGWTTDATHYIKIWTDPNEPYRHNGKWDDGKYRLEVYSYATNGAFGILTGWVTVEGLQISTKAVDGNPYKILTVITAGNIWLNNTIFKGITDNHRVNLGLNVYGYNKLYLYNNLIYNTGIGIWAQRTSDENLYAYNNTLFDCGRGIHSQWKAGGGVATAKNNLIASTTDPYYDSFAAGTDYNTTDINDTPGVGTHNRVNQTFYFADLANNDFHLAPGDTGAMDYGEDLSTDTNLPFALDIDNQTRAFGLGASSTKWDIGADEFSPTAIYRSVGPSKTDALSSGFSGTTLSISGSTATFSTNQPDNIGVGDVIVYADTQGGTTATNSIAFIHGRTDPTHYTVKDVAGKIASSTNTATAKWAIYRAYASLAKAEDGDENDGLPDSLEAFESWSGGKNLASSTEQWNIACYANGTTADTAATTINGWTTSESNNINVFTPYLSSEAGASQRHNGKWDESKYKLVPADVPFTIDIYNSYTKIDGLQISVSSSLGVGYTVRSITTRSSALYNEISNSIMKMGNVTGGANADGILAYNSKIWNNIIYGFSNAGIASIVGLSYVYNNTVINSTFGIYSNYQTTVIKNNIAYNNITDYNSTTWHSSCTNNLSKDSTAPAVGTYYRNKKVNFVDAKNNDFHLAGSDTNARDMGADLSADAYLPFNTDIDGDARLRSGSGAARWDIGADEGTGVAVVGVNTTKNQITDGLVGYWSFDGPDMDWASTTAEVVDRSGNGNNGNMMNMSVKAAIGGKLGQGLKFDGVDDYIETRVNSMPKRMEPLSLSAWIYTNSLVNSGNIISKLLNDKIDNCTDWSLQFSNSNHILFYGVSSGNTGIYQIDSTIALSVNKWHHIVVTFNGNLTASFYIDSVQTSSSFTYANLGFTDYGSNNIKIGSSTSAILDDVRVYNRALSADEISELYRLGSARTITNLTPNGNTSGLVGHWTFDGPDMDWASTTAEVVDRSGYGNNGNMMNMSVKSAIAGKIGQGLKFDGVDDYIDANSSVSLDDIQVIGTGLSLSLWLKNDKYSHIQPVLISKGNVNNNGFWGFSLDSTGPVIRFYKDFGTPGWNSDDLGVKASYSNSYLGKWKYVILTWDGSSLASNVHFYFDNIEVVKIYSVDGTGSPVSDAALSLYIGNAKDTDQILNGIIDDVRIYNRALSADEVSELYRIGSRKLEINPNR